MHSGGSDDGIGGARANSEGSRATIPPTIIYLPTLANSGAHVSLGQLFTLNQRISMDRNP
jgi:hypothetical protein